MNYLKKIICFLMVCLTGTIFISCSNKTKAPNPVKQQTPNEFVELLFTETNPNKYVYYIKHNDKVYNSDGSIKDEEFENCLEFSEQIRTMFQEMYKTGNISFNEPYDINVSGWGEFKVVGVSDGMDVMDFCLLPKNNTYQLFYNSSLGINDYTFIQYKAGDDYDKPNSFRVVAKLDDYFNYSFRDKESDYYSIALSESAAIGNERLNAYVKKDSEAGEKLFNIVKDGRPHKVILEFHVPKTEKPSNSIVVIDNLISDSWVYPKVIE